MTSTVLQSLPEDSEEVKKKKKEPFEKFLSPAKFFTNWLYET